MQRARWRASTPIERANESFTISTSPAVRYCVRTGAGCWYDTGNARLDPGEPERAVNVDQAYLEIQVPVVREQLLKAGVRLGGFLNEALGD